MRAKQLVALGYCALLVTGLVFSLTRADGNTASVDKEGGAVREHVLADGSRVAVPESPVRIFPGTAAAFDWLAGLVAPERIVALPEQATRWSVLARATGDEQARWSALRRLPNFTGEAVLDLEPDLVFTSPWQDRAVVTRLRGAGIAVIDLPVFGDWEGLVESGLTVAALVGAVPEGEALVQALERRRRALAEREDPARLRVLPYTNYGGGGSTVGAGETLDLAIRLAGYENAAALAGIQGHQDLRAEEILGMQFDAFLVSGDHGLSPSAEALRGNRALRDVEAIRAERFLVLPSALHASASHTVIDAAEELARQGDALGR